MHTFSAIRSDRLLAESRTAPAAAVVAERAGSMTHLTVLQRARAQRTIMFFAAATALASMMFSSLPVAWEANRSAPSLRRSRDTAAAGLDTPRHLALGRSCLIPKADERCSQDGESQTQKIRSRRWSLGRFTERWRMTI